VVAFGRRFEASFGRPATSLAAEGFDAANLALGAAADGVRERDRLFSELADEPLRVGVSGVLQIGEDGELARRPHLLGIASGAVVCVDEVGAAPAQRAPAAPAQGR
jgi:hypothetical protein